MTEHKMRVFAQIVGELERVDDPLLKELLVLHAPVVAYSSPVQCYGCDQGCSCDAAYWPCQTVKTIIRGLKIELPDKWDTYTYFQGPSEKDRAWMESTNVKEGN